MDTETLLRAAAVGAALFLAWRMFGGGPKVSAADARSLVAEGATLVDVRSDAEFASGHLPGAVHIPVDRIAARAGEIPSDKPVVLYCASGMRSASAAKTLRGLGRENVHNLGGMARWGE